MNNCKICKSELQNEKLLMRAKQFPVKGKPQPIIYTYEAWCTVCEIYLTRNTGGKSTGKWELPSIDKEAILTEIDENQFQTLKIEIENLPSGDKFEEFIKRNGLRFISLIKKDDIILQFTEVLNDKNQIGYAIKRNDYIIGKFINFNQLKKE